jgi:16S rRNA (guanine527-N7)-methyltransferase
MSTLSESEITDLLSPYLAVSKEVVHQLSDYLDLLLRWNARTNLTAIRSPQEIVRRHFGESLFAGRHLRAAEQVDSPLPDTVLDFGSGGGFPGLPIALLHPEISVTLSESQNKKSTFLREVARSLGLKNVEVWAGRAEDLPGHRIFDTVTLRAVDDMKRALSAAHSRAKRQMVLLTTGVPELPPGFSPQPPLPIPGSDAGILLRLVRN